MLTFREAIHSASDGAQLAYRVREGGDPWVLLHALACDSTLWDAVVRALPEDVGLVIPELRGHGGSTPGWELPSVDRFAADVLEILDAEKIERPGIAGVSMGGCVALAMAVARPELARTWIFISTHARAEDEAGKAGRAEALGLVDRQGWLTWITQVGPSWTASDKHHPHLEGMAGRAGDSGLTLALLALANRPDRGDVLPRLSQPVVAVAGELDPITPRERLQEIADATPQGRLVVVPGASHLVPLDAPEALAALLG
jgi:pimeloyl-ACP methyl ester carboxylesterase